MILASRNIGFYLTQLRLLDYFWYKLWSPISARSRVRQHWHPTHFSQCEARPTQEAKISQLKAPLFARLSICPRTLNLDCFLSSLCLINISHHVRRTKSIDGRSPKTSFFSLCQRRKTTSKHPPSYPHHRPSGLKKLQLIERWPKTTLGWLIALDDEGNNT